MGYLYTVNINKYMHMASLQLDLYFTNCECMALLSTLLSNHKLEIYLYVAENLIRHSQFGFQMGPTFFSVGNYADY